MLASWDTRLQACCVWVCTSVCPAMCICVYLYSVHICLFRNTHSGRTRGYEAAEVSPLLGYCICQLLIDLSSADEQLQVWDTQYVTEDLAQGHCRIPVGLQFANRRLFIKFLCFQGLPFTLLPFFTFFREDLTGTKPESIFTSIIAMLETLRFPV